MAVPRLIHVSGAFSSLPLLIPLGQLLKDLGFPADKNKIIQFVQRQQERPTNIITAGLVQQYWYAYRKL